MEMTPQGYALYAAVDFEGEGKPCLCMVVAWEQVTGQTLVPMVVSIGEAGADPSTFGQAERAATGADAVLYIGPDRGAAQIAVNNATRSTQSASRGGTVRRYVQGATAPCDDLGAHASHLWVPDDHPYAIRCAGVPA